VEADEERVDVDAHSERLLEHEGQDFLPLLLVEDDRGERRRERERSDARAVAALLGRDALGLDHAGEAEGPALLLARHAVGVAEAVVEAAEHADARPTDVRARAEPEADARGGAKRAASAEEDESEDRYGAAHETSSEF
jgi:hypothetical protein